MAKAWAISEVTGAWGPGENTTFAQRKAARKLAASAKVVGFEVLHHGEVIATFKNKADAVAFTKSSSVNTECGWLVKPSGAAIKTGSLAYEPVCEIAVVRA